MFDIKHESLYTSAYTGIKYINMLNYKFNPDQYSGRLLFYPGNPLYLVCVTIWADKRENLTEADIEVQCGDLHCSSLIREDIIAKKDLIYEMCKTYFRPYFVLDLEKLHIIEDRDFTSLLPSRGVNTLFMFENYAKGLPYNMLVNSTKSASNTDIMAWFNSYIYAGNFCLANLTQPEPIAIQFLQAITSLSLSKGDKRNIYVSSNNLVLDAPMNNNGDFDIEIPGNKTSRFMQLVEKSVEQKMNKKGKK